MNQDNQKVQSQPHPQSLTPNSQTPLMRQFWDAKSAHPDKIVLFRMGDFFEMFFDDAKAAAPILGITLTSRNKKSQDETPMCGVPHHSIGAQINKLLKSGLKVAICDQIEDPKSAKGIVKRAVTRILTPGMIYDTVTLDQKRALYMSCVEFGKTSSVAFAETTTGEFFYFEDLSIPQLFRLLTVLPVAEVVTTESLLALPIDIKTHVDEKLSLLKNTNVMITAHDFVGAGQSSGNVTDKLLTYIRSMNQSENQVTFHQIERRSLQGKLELSETALKHLEVFETSRNEYQGSLCWAVDRTKSSAGARLLREWLSFPLTDKKEIQIRQNQIAAWINDIGRLKTLREILGAQGDLERRLGRIITPQACARDLVSLAQYIENALKTLSFAKNFLNIDTDFSKLQALQSSLQSTFLEESPLSVRQGEMIQKGVSAELDEWIELATNSQGLVQRLEEQEKACTGISSLKVRYNNVFGYYIEITHIHKDKVPSHYLRKQTLANAERYTTDELTEIEKKVLVAQTRRNELEYQIYETVRNKVLSFSAEISKLAHIISELDVLTSFAWLAIEKKYVRPELLDQQEIHLQASRHPVVEQSLKVTFTANQIDLNEHDCLLLTGPNMAGKSTLMRQVGLTAVLAQVGSYVPAAHAQVAVFDKIFTRIGASDSLSEGLSTFMVEMKEAAEILKSATAKSLVILDEIGRGTSTYDGMSLAQSILEYLLTDIKPLVLFATHYHELTSLERNYPQIKNAHMTVAEKNGEIRFLHTLVKGPATKSYGIHVGKLAGLPITVTERAKLILKNLETFEAPSAKSASPQMNLFEQMQTSVIQSQDQEKHQKLIDDHEQLKRHIRDIDISNITPIAALVELANIQKLL